MKLKFKCSSCGIELILHDVEKNSTTKCPFCDNEIIVPEDALEIEDTKEEITSNEECKEENEKCTCECNEECYEKCSEECKEEICEEATCSCNNEADSSNFEKCTCNEENSKEDRDEKIYFEFCRKGDKGKNIDFKFCKKINMGKFISNMAKNFSMFLLIYSFFAGPKIYEKFTGKKVESSFRFFFIIPAFIFFILFNFISLIIKYEMNIQKNLETTNELLNKIVDKNNN